MKRLSGRTALVTGAAGGLGAHVARRLAREGMRVAVTDVREEPLAALADELGTLGVDAAAIPADLSHDDAPARILERAEAALGQVDLLVNNAGMEAVAPFAESSPEVLRRAIAVNLTAPLVLTRCALPGMLERGDGHIVFMSSAAGKFGTAYNEPYAAAKAGLIALTQALRAEYAGSDVGFSAICPGFVTGAGMYERWAERGVKAGRLLGNTSVDVVTSRLVDAVVHDRPEVVATGLPVRPLFALGELMPRLVERLMRLMGATDFFRRVAAGGTQAPQAPGDAR